MPKRTRGPTWIFNKTRIADPQGRGQRAVEFLKLLRHPKSRLAQQAFQLDPPFERIVRRIYGPTDDNGARQIRTVYLQVGKGSRKTSLAAALALLHTFGPERIPRGENLVAAADRKQARIAFEESLGIVETVPQLAAAAKPIDSRNRLHHPRSGSRFEAISSDAVTQHGRTPSFVLVDELWAHKNSALWQAVRTGVTKAPGSLLIVATTAGRGDDSPDYPIYEYAKKVQSGEIDDPTFLPIIFEAPSKCAFDDEKVWHKVLPGLKFGYPDLPSLRQLAREAAERPADREAFKQFYLGIRASKTSAPFVDMEVFDEGFTNIDADALAGRACWLAVDLGIVNDLSAVVAAFPDDAEGFDVLAWAFCPEDHLQTRQERDKAPYLDWRDEGHLIPTPGTVTDHRCITDLIKELCETYDVQEIASDPAYAQAVTGTLNDEGYPVAHMRQGWVTMAPAVKEMERAILGRRMRWNSPALRWCVSNVVLDTDKAGNHTFHKGKSRDRIDVAQAAAMAIGRAGMGFAGLSVYDDEVARPTGLLIF